MGRVNTTFKRLRWEKEAALLTRVTVGYPSTELSRQILPVMARQGADLVVAHLDPGLPLDECLGIVSDARRASEVPLVLSTDWAAIGDRMSFLHRCVEAGADGILIPSSVEGYHELRSQCEAADVSAVALVSEGADAHEIVRELEGASGFVLLASTPTPDFLSNLREQTTLPLATHSLTDAPDDVSHLASLSEGVVVGATLPERLKDTPEDDIVFTVGEYVRDLKAATLREK
jgi:tryptophan synthase alpha chain